MAIIKSDSTDLTINADGASSNLKLQIDGVEKASISSAGAFTSTTIDATVLTGDLPVISGANLTGLGGGTSYALLAYSVADGSNGSAPTTGAWTQRELNTEVFDPDSIVTLSSNSFTLGSGKYIVQWHTTMYRFDTASTRLYNESDSSVVGYANNVKVLNADYVSMNAQGESYVDISSSKTFGVYYHIETAATGSGGLGVKTNNTGFPEQYATVSITKIG